MTGWFYGLSQRRLEEEQFREEAVFQIMEYGAAVKMTVGT